MFKKRSVKHLNIHIGTERGNMSLYDKNVVIKTTGGLKLREQSVNLAVIMSIHLQ